jgi:hypothetical protein
VLALVSLEARFDADNALAHSPAGVDGGRLGHPRRGEGVAPRELDRREEGFLAALSADTWP